MKNYMRTMLENYFVKNQIVLTHVWNEGDPAEILKRNSYALLNVSPRFFRKENICTEVLRAEYQHKCSKNV